MRAPEQQTTPERPSLDQIQAMIEAPSDVALQRIEMFRQADPILIGGNDTADKLPMQLFLEGELSERQLFGFYDEVVAALHGDDEQFQTMLRDAVKRNPRLLLASPEVLSPLFEANEHEQLHRALMRQSEWWYDVRNIFSICNNQEKEVFSNQNAKRASRPVTASVLLAHATNIDTPEKSRQLKESFTTYTFQDIRDLFDYYGVSYIGKSRQREAELSIESLKKLIAQGVIDSEYLETAIQTSMVNATDNKEDRLAALEAKLVLAANGLLSAKLGEPERLHAMATEYVRTALQGEEGDSPGFYLFHLIASGFMNASRARELVMQHSGAEGALLWADISERLRCFERKEMFNEDMHEYMPKKSHMSIEKLRQWHKTHIIDNESWSEYSKYDITESMNYQGPEAVLAQDILEKWYDTHGVDLWSDWYLNRLTNVFSSNPDRLREIIRKNLDREGVLYFDLTQWDQLAELMSYSDETMQELARVRLKNCESVVNLCGNLTAALKAKKPLLTTEAAAGIFAECLQTHDFDEHDYQSVVDFAMGSLGSALTKEYIEPYFASHPGLEMRFGMTRDISLQKIEESDIYDVYNNSFLLPTLLEHLTPDEAEDFVGKIAGLPPELISDLVDPIWHEISKEQKGALVERLMKNRALLELTFSGPQMELLREFWAPNGVAALGAAQEVDLLQQCAPKAYATYRRRVATKERRLRDAQDTYMSQSQSTEARVAARALLTAHYDRIERGGSSDIESKRADILTHYAYYYDLCIRLEEFMEGASVPPEIRGKNEDKNELRALELFALLHEAGGVHRLSDIVSVPKEQLDERALHGALHSASLTAEEKQTIKQYLLTNNIDFVKFGTWLHVSSRSSKVHGYMTSFVKHLATGGDVISWKNGEGNNTQDLSSSVQDAWLGEAATDVRFGAGNSATIRFTNDLNALYLCGARPVDNCLHYAYGLNQRALPGLLSSDVKLVLIENVARNPIGNAIIRIIYKDGAPRVTLEPLYTSVHNSDDSAELHRAVIMATEQYVKSIGLELNITRVHTYEAAYDKKMKNAVRLMWADTATRDTSVELVETTAPYTYGDGSGLSSKRAFARVTERLMAAGNL